MVAQLVIKLCHTLHGANLGLFLVTHRLAYKNEELFKLFMTYSCSGSIYMKEMKIKQNYVEFQN